MAAAAATVSLCRETSNSPRPQHLSACEYAMRTANDVALEAGGVSVVHCPGSLVVNHREASR